MAAVQPDADDIFVHFSSVDNMGHTYGNLHAITMGKMQQTDTYIGRLPEEFRSRVIITADHDMHKKQGAITAYSAVRISPYRT